MELTYHGANCISLTTKKATIVVDGAIKQVGLKDVVKKGSIQLATQTGFAPDSDAAAITIDMPGEYEVQGISIRGVAAKRMIDYDGSKQAVMYQIRIQDLVIAVLGHVAQPLDEDQLESLGIVDIVVVPVGGGGYTLDGHQVATAVRQIDPKIIIPVHYADPAIKYEVSQEPIEPFIKELGLEVEVLDKLKLKGLPETMKMVQLQRQ